MITTVRNAVVGLLIAATAAVAVAEEKPNDAGMPAKIANGGLNSASLAPAARCAGGPTVRLLQSPCGREEPCSLKSRSPRATPRLLRIGRPAAHRASAEERPACGSCGATRRAWQGTASCRSRGAAGRRGALTAIDDGDCETTRRAVEDRLSLSPRLGPYAKEALAVPVAESDAFQGTAPRTRWLRKGLAELPWPRSSARPITNPMAPASMPPATTAKPITNRLCSGATKRATFISRWFISPRKRQLDAASFISLCGHPQRRGDWTTAAERYRVLPAARASREGTPQRGLTRIGSGRPTLGLESRAVGRRAAAGRRTPATPERAG